MHSRLSRRDVLWTGATGIAGAVLQSGCLAANGEEHAIVEARRHASKQLVIRLYGTLMAKGDTRAADEILSPAYVDHDISGLPADGGREQLKQAVLGVRSAFPDVQPRLHELVAEGDLVSVRVTAHGTHTGAPFMGIQPAGKKMLWKEQHIFRVAEGRIVEHWGVFDLLSILQQLGAITAPR